MESLESGLITDLKHGIRNNETELDLRNNRFGNNKRPEVVSRSFGELLWEAL